MTDHGFWDRRWREGDTGWHEADGNALVRAHLSALALPPGARVLVPLCGRTRELDWLAARGYTAVGVEWSAAAVAGMFADRPATRDEGPRGERYRHMGVVVWRADWFALAPEDVGSIAAVVDRAAMIAMPPPRRAAYVAQIKRLAPRAPVLLVTLEHGGAPEQGPPFPVLADEVERLYGPAYARRELARRSDTRGDRSEKFEVCALVAPR